jgi:deoxycytidine triphosphate deaminase
VRLQLDVERGVVAPEEIYGPFEYANCEAEAKGRAARWRHVDPFLEEIPPALLSAQHFIQYVKCTALIYPFFETKDRIKSASYEVQAGKNSIRWDEDGRKIVSPVTEATPLYLPKNSITFAQIESDIFLPEYIALRFNLRITQVHRGLLLGTGPLVDPQFEGNLLIPIHNLTDQDYTIPKQQGLIWVEFTKTSRPDPRGSYQIESRKRLLSPEAYLEKANNNNPIRSSIRGAITEVQKKADAAEVSARKAKRSSQLFLTVGFLGIAAMVISTVVALHSYFGTIGALAGSVQDKASTALGKVDQALSAGDENKKGLDDVRKEIQALRTELNALKEASEHNPRGSPPKVK